MHGPEVILLIQYLSRPWNIFRIHETGFYNGTGLDLNPGTLSFTTTYRRKVTDGSGAVAYSNEVTIF